MKFPLLLKTTSTFSSLSLTKHTQTQPVSINHSSIVILLNYKILNIDSFVWFNLLPYFIIIIIWNENKNKFTKIYKSFFCFAYFVSLLFFHFCLFRIFLLNKLKNLRKKKNNFVSNFIDPNIRIQYSTCAHFNIYPLYLVSFFHHHQYIDDGKCCCCCRCWQRSRTVSLFTLVIFLSSFFFWDLSISTHRLPFMDILKFTRWFFFLM